MKFFSWIKKHKYQTVVVVAFLLAFMVIYFFIQGLKKDHSLDLVNMQIQLKEEARQEIIKLREQLNEREDDLNLRIVALHIKDSLIQQNNLLIDKRLNALPKYNEKAKQINNFSDADLLDYFNKLPVQPDNDY